MNFDFLWPLLLGSAVFLVLHILVWRLYPSNTPGVDRLMILGAIGVAAALGASVLHPRYSTELAFTVASASIFFLLLYMFFYAGIARSVSVTLLGQLLQSPSGTLAFSKLRDDYAASNRFEDRLTLLEQLTLVRMNGSAVQLTPRGQRTARQIDTLAAIFSEGLEG